MLQKRIFGVSLSWLNKVCLLILCNFMWIRPAYAAVTLNLLDMVKNLAADLPELISFVTALAYVLGFYFIVHGIMLMKKFAEQRSMMSSEAKMTPPIVSLAVGAALIYLPSTVQSGLTTFWLNPTPFQYDTGSGDEWAELYNACFMIIQLLGIIAFIRGLILLSHLGGQASQHGTLGRAIAHIVGGIFLIDIQDFITAIFTTFGLGELLSR